MVTPYLDYGLYFATCRFSAETRLHAMRLIMSRAFYRHPKLRIVLRHMREGLPYSLQRIDNRYAMQVSICATDKLPKLPSQYFLDNFFITTAASRTCRSCSSASTSSGVERIMFAADFPYETTPSRALHGWRRGHRGQRRKIYETNALRIFKLQV